MAKIQNHLASIAEKSEALHSRRFNEQCGAICYRTSTDNTYEVLLITSLDTGRWVIPKGNISKKEVAREASAREATEEAGVTGNVGMNPFGRYTYVKADEKYPYIVEVYLLEVTGSVKRYAEKNKRVLEWVSAPEASRRVDEPELKGLFNRFAHETSLSAGRA